MEKHTEAPIFFDHKGRRWKKIRLVLFVSLLVLGAGAYVTVPQILDRNTVTPLAIAATPGDAKVADSASGLTPTEVSALVGRTNTPVIGDGPLVQVVHVQPGGQNKNVIYAVPLYSKTGAVPLTVEERLVVGDHEFALQRYGKSTATKQIALTYDDGPDPAYTPQILDILARHKVQATFFVTGSNVTKYSSIISREASEGHVIGNHTFNHVDFDFVGPTRGEQEVNQTNRVITATTGSESSFFRLPYMGNDEQSLRSHILGILTAQRQGYVVVNHDFDSEDWQFAAGFKADMPKFDGTSQIVLLHDAGGNRAQTAAYTDQLIKEAKANGYSFVTLNQMYSQKPALFAAAKPSYADKASLVLASSYLVWPRIVISKLFVLTVAMLIFTMVINVLLAVYNMRKSKFGRRPRGYRPLVSVIISAYNEDKVLGGTVRSVLASNYRHLEIIIVDDGSKDHTGIVAAGLAKRYKRVRSFTKQNGGKSSGLNFGIKHAKGDIVIGIDADTVFPAQTVGNLIRHFADPEVGAVAGNVKVGNIRNLITRWQMLDYIIGIHIERNAQAALNSVLIVPGACGAWRKSVILAAGGYKHVTLAEDFDLTMNVHRLGYKVLQDDSAISYTEAPDTLQALTKQRFRWMYGTMQAFWKHRDMMFRRRYGWMGMLVMPLSITNVLIPIIFVPMLLIINLENILAGNWHTIVLFFFATMFIQLLTGFIALTMAKEDYRHLLAIPFTRLVYSPIRTTLLYRTVIRALRGAYAGSAWNTARTGTVSQGNAKAAPLQRIQLSPVQSVAAAADIDKAV
jgi:cellulose synthase/poly-beta-1,6-N-acetylglucosamine synthase-like glycosyltransferase/peptidoglycan/xylan/chitin deacetylase (PgdA/CDA1 family)